MLSIDQHKRPSVEQLMMHPRVCLVIKFLENRRREKDIARKEKDVKALEKSCRDKQEAIQAKQSLIEQKKVLIASLENQVKLKLEAENMTRRNQSKDRDQLYLAQQKHIFMHPSQENISDQ